MRSRYVRISIVALTLFHRSFVEVQHATVAAMNLLNRRITDRQWNDFWARVFGSLFLASVICTSLDPRWRKVCVGLVCFALGLFFTTSHYSRKSMTKFFYLGGWYDNLDQVHNDPELPKRMGW